MLGTLLGFQVHLCPLSPTLRINYIHILCLDSPTLLPYCWYRIVSCAIDSASYRAANNQFLSQDAQSRYLVIPENLGNYLTN